MITATKKSLQNTGETPAAVRIVGKIPTDTTVKDGQRFLFISKSQRNLTHAIHKYPAKFFPELPNWIIRRYSNQGDTILDPFMGSGTTNLEAMLLQRRSVGVDIDPLSRLIARVKTTLLPKTELLKGYNWMREHILSFNPVKHDMTNRLPQFPYRDNWFRNHVLHELAFIKDGIEQTPCSNAMRDFLLVSFSSIVRQVSQADNGCTRTVIRRKLQKVVKPGYAIDLFCKRLKNNVTGMLELTEYDTENVEIPDDASATDLSTYKDDFFDLALTSPPYVNAVDYPRTHQLEIYWLGFANGSLKHLKQTHIGTEVVTALDYSKLHKTEIEAADKVIKTIYEEDPRRAFIAYKFIQDMLANMRSVYRTLKPGGHYVIVIGNNIIRGQRFESWRYLRDAAPMLGYKVECRFESAIINHFIKVPRKERIEEDHILVLQK